MKPSLAVLTFGVALAAGVFHSGEAAAQRDRCADYANQMIAQDQRARQMKCPNWSSHSNYNHHYSWCQARPPQQAQQALADWGTRFQACQFAAGGSPAAQQDLKRCQDFTNFAMAAFAKYDQASCPPRNYMHGNRNGHYNWCMKKTQQQVTADWNLKQRGLNACLNGGIIP